MAAEKEGGDQLSAKTAPVCASTNLSETSSNVGCDLVGTKGPGFGVLNDQANSTFRDQRRCFNLGSVHSVQQTFYNSLLPSNEVDLRAPGF